jgi:hypothetical protein
VGFSKHTVFLTPTGRQAFEEAVADTLAGKKVQIVIGGCESGTEYTDASVCARRALSLIQLLAGRGVRNPTRLVDKLQ